MDDNQRKAYWATVTDLPTAVDIFLENSYVVGTDPYYSDLNDALWAMLTRAREAHGREKTEEAGLL
jgi:hypothetical protein